MSLFTLEVYWKSTVHSNVDSGFSFVYFCKCLNVTHMQKVAIVDAVVLCLAFAIWRGLYYTLNAKMNVGMVSAALSLIRG